MQAEKSTFKIVILLWDFSKHRTNVVVYSTVHTLNWIPSKEKAMSKKYN
jgi:hypothetical protein